MRLRGLAKHCEFNDVDREILQQFIIGIKRPDVERKCCTTENLDLAKAIDLATNFENLEANLNGLHAPTERELGRQGINRIEGEEKNWNRTKKQTSGVQRPGPTNNRASTSNHRTDTCSNCGRQRHQNKEECPAFGKTCRNCGKQNHFAGVCRSNPSDQ